MERMRSRLRQERQAGRDDHYCVNEIPHIDPQPWCMDGVRAIRDVRFIR